MGNIFNNNKIPSIIVPAQIIRHVYKFGKILSSKSACVYNRQIYLYAPNMDFVENKGKSYKKN
jgi:hypothetical protein